MLVAGCVVVFAYWQPLFAGGSLVPSDAALTVAPFASDAIGLAAEPSVVEPIDTHAHWAALADDVRSGDLTWWNPAVGAGEPSWARGLPIFELVYLVVPSWFAPGLVAALRTLTAVLATSGWMRALGARLPGALTAGLAYGFSGVMVAHTNQSLATVVVLAPALFWSVERSITDPRPRRAIPMAALLAAMIWSAAPVATVYAVGGAVLYAVVRFFAGRPTTDARGRTMVAIGLGAFALGLALASPHLVGSFAQIDHAGRSVELGSTGTEGGTNYLLTLAAPTVFGSDAVGPGWFGEGIWSERQTYVGASVLLLAALGVTGALRSTGADGTRRRIVVALGAVALAGIVVGYVGTPIDLNVPDGTGDPGTSTQAKLLIALAVAALAGLGVDGWTRPGWRERRLLGRRALVAAGGLVGAGLFALVPLSSVVDDARALGVTRQLVATLTVPILAAAVVAAGVIAVLVGWLDGRAFGALAVGTVTFELLVFAMPVVTVADTDERLVATDAHAEVRSHLDPGERLHGDDLSFWPGSTTLFDIDDVRGRRLRSPGEVALLTRPGTAIDARWNAFAVGVWSASPASLPPGKLVVPVAGGGWADPAEGSLQSELVVPDGGLRALVFEMEMLSAPSGVVSVSISTVGNTIETVRLGRSLERGLVSFAITGEHLEPGSVATIQLTSTGSPGEVLVAVDGGKRLSLGFVAGIDDGLQVVFTGSVTLIEREQARFARLYDAEVVASDPQVAAGLVADRPDTDAGRAVVAASVGLPSASDPTAELVIRRLVVGRDRISVDISTDREALVVVSTDDHPGWSATVDGLPSSIVTADAAFIGVRVPPGDHTLTLRFQPRHLWWTAALAALGLVAMVLVLAKVDPVRSRGARR